MHSNGTYHSSAGTAAVYARRRLGAGIVLGLIIALLIAAVMGFLLSADLNLKVRVGSTLISCLVATPVACAIGFAIGLSGKLRRLGIGIVLGSLIMTGLIAGAFFLL